MEQQQNAMSEARRTIINSALVISFSEGDRGEEKLRRDVCMDGERNK
jgi:hypothetical protein